MNTGNIVGLCVFIGIAFGCINNRLEGIEARISDIDRRVALLAEELGEKVADQGGHDGVHGRPDRREEKSPDTAEPAADGSIPKGLAPLPCDARENGHDADAVLEPDDVAGGDEPVAKKVLEEGGVAAAEHHLAAGSRNPFKQPDFILAHEGDSTTFDPLWKGGKA